MNVCGADTGTNSRDENPAFASSSFVRSCSSHFVSRGVQPGDGVRSISTLLPSVAGSVSIR